jgi:hypothetical protein
VRNYRSAIYRNQAFLELRFAAPEPAGYLFLLQRRQPAASICASEEHQGMIADEITATLGKEKSEAGQTSPLFS